MFFWNFLAFLMIQLMLDLWFVLWFLCLFQILKHLEIHGSHTVEILKF